MHSVSTSPSFAACPSRLCLYISSRSSRTGRDPVALAIVVAPQSASCSGVLAPPALADSHVGRRRPHTAGCPEVGWLVTYCSGKRMPWRCITGRTAMVALLTDRSLPPTNVICSLCLRVRSLHCRKRTDNDTKAWIGTEAGGGPRTMPTGRVQLPVVRAMIGTTDAPPLGTRDTARRNLDCTALRTTPQDSSDEVASIASESHPATPAPQMSRRPRRRCLPRSAARPAWRAAAR